MYPVAGIRFAPRDAVVYNMSNGGRASVPPYRKRPGRGDVSLRESREARGRGTTLDRNLHKRQAPVDRPRQTARRWLALWVCVALALVFDAACLAGEESVSQTIRMGVVFRNVLILSGSPLLVVRDAVAGMEPTPVTDTSTTYSVGSDGSYSKITASIDRSMPPGTAMKLWLEPPPGATSTEIALEENPRVAVSSIKSVFACHKRVSYTLVALASAGVFPSATRTVTLTLSD